MAVRTLGSSGRNHSVINSWISYIGPVLSEIEYGEMYADSVFTYTNQGSAKIHFTGLTVSAVAYAHLRPAAGEWHVGVAGSGIKIDWEGQLGDVIQIDEAYTIVEGLEITNWHGTTDQWNLVNCSAIVFTGWNDIRIRRNIIHDNDGTVNRMAAGIRSNTSNNNYYATVDNNLIYNIEGGTARTFGIVWGVGASGSNLYTCAYNTIKNIKSTAGVGKGVGISGSASSRVVGYGNLVIDCTYCFASLWHVNSDYNTDDDATAPGGNSQQTAQSDAQLFIDPGSDNFLSKKYSDVEDFVPYSALYTPSVDIKEDTRPGAGNTWGGCSNVPPIISAGTMINKNLDTNLNGVMA